MDTVIQTLRDQAVYAYGYMHGRTYLFPRSLSEVYALTISKVTSFISLPLPLLSFLALPVFGGTSTSINLLLFYMTWSSLVLSHSPLHIELYGALAIRTLFFLLPALAFLAFDLFLPSASKSIKAYGRTHLPAPANRRQLSRIIFVAIFNTALSSLLHGVLEVLATDVLHMRSILKVTTTVPLPWTIAQDLLKGFFARGILHYGIHRYILHTYESPLKTWHNEWQHSVRLPYSLLAAYDHPACHLLTNFLPVFLPAYLFRFHVLTFHLLLVLTCLESLFIYSGYAVLPSSIVVAGMARRTDAHFATAARGEACNFGHWGVLDLVFGTYCKDTQSAIDDLQDEAEKHQVEERAHGAVNAIMGNESESEDAGENDDDDEEFDPAGDQNAKQEAAIGGAADEQASSPGNRRSARNKLRRNK